MRPVSPNPKHAPGHELEPLATVTAREGIEPLTHRLNDLRRWLADDLVAVDVALGSLSDSDIAWNAANYLLGNPGKRIRPLCVLLAARHGGRPFDRAVRDLASACEMVHAATLLHDDVIDEGDERRGVPAARRVFGNSASILGGDYLLVEALRRVESTRLPEVLRSLLKVIASMVGAEATQLEARGSVVPSRERYLSVVEGKTAALFGWGLNAGAAAAGMDDEEKQALTEVGETFGVAFQMVDDLLDLDGDPTVTGKSTLTDLREGKLTWPLIFAMEQDPTLGDALRVAISTGDMTMAPKLVARVKATGAIEATRCEVDGWAQRALDALRRLDSTPATDGIAAVIHAAIHRTR